MPYLACARGIAIRTKVEQKSRVISLYWEKIKIYFQLVRVGTHFSLCHSYWLLWAFMLKSFHAIITGVVWSVGLVQCTALGEEWEREGYISFSLSPPLFLFLPFIWGKRGYQKFLACLGKGEKVDKGDTKAIATPPPPSLVPRRHNLLVYS